MEAYEDAFDEHGQVAKDTEAVLHEPFGTLAAWCVEAIVAGGKLLFFGNGGSAADAQHLATELVVRFARMRDPIAALALTTDTSVLTAIGNDFGFDALFSRQIAALGTRSDLAIAISTSGNSLNVLNGIRQAKAQGLRTVALTGKTGGSLRHEADLVLRVPSDTTARIQEMHIVLGHALCETLERELA